LKVLVVDDHETVRKGVCAILTTHFEPAICEEAANGEEAIAKALVLRPDIVICDVSMPIMGGFAAAQKLQRLLPSVPILFLTMHGGDSFVAEVRRAGVKGLVAKDRAGDVLIDAVKALLNSETFFGGPMSTAKITKPGTVEKIIKPPDPRDPEKAQINVHGAEPLYQEIRIDNTLTDENGTQVKLKEGATVEVHVEADKSATTPKKD
jgi:DNA-binding NarL/FixJ family response regulator